MMQSCASNGSTQEHEISDEENAYWFGGQAEITSFKIQQARYGEIREGYAIMVFVSEHFSKTNFTKTDSPSNEDQSVLKLNFLKKFNTGIYDYSIMTSTFLPFNERKHSLKITTSVQEWCGHVFMELINQNKNFNVLIKSYFEGENDQEHKLDKTYLEDDFWSLIRLNPALIPTGNTEVIPSFAFLRLKHLELKAYSCDIFQEEISSTEKELTLNYPAIDRKVTIRFQKDFPYRINGWSETYESGFGENKKVQTSTGEAMVTIKSAYWEQNQNNQAFLRDSLNIPN